MAPAGKIHRLLGHASTAITRRYTGSAAKPRGTADAAVLADLREKLHCLAVFEFHVFDAVRRAIRDKKLLVS
jgi:hypothetical protein